MAHNRSKDPDSIPIDLTDCYEDETHTIRKMMHSNGYEQHRRGGAEFIDEDSGQ